MIRKVINVRMDKDKKTKLELLAKLNNLSANEYINQLIDVALDENKEKMLEFLKE
ncbi:MAG: hypothetical protein ACRCVG_04690 [Methanobacteriaceae archaeon]